MRTKPLSVTVAALAVLTASACGATSTDSGAAAAGSDGKAVSGLRMMVPNSPGGGYDVTARTGAKVLEDAKIANGVEVFNLSGAGGTVGLAKLVNEKGNGDLSMMMGLGVVGATYTNKSAAKLSGTTPIARLIEEPSGIMVSKDSPYQSISDLVKAWKANPKMAVGGGSNPGGPDHLLPMQLAQAVGIDAKTVNFVSYDGGGDLLPAILGNKIGFATSGTGEYVDQIKSGAVRVLATTGEKRLELAAGRQDPQGAGRQPGLHQLARRRGPSRHQRRRQAEVGRRHRQDALQPGVEGRRGQERLDRRLPQR